MKKIFALALLGLFTITFSDNVIASTDNTDVVLTVDVNDSPAYDYVYETVGVVTHFTKNVTVFTVSTISEGQDAFAVNTVSNLITYKTFEIFVDLPIDYEICYGVDNDCDLLNTNLDSIEGEYKVPIV